MKKCPQCGKKLKENLFWCSNDECDFGFLIGKDNQEPETLNAYAPAPSFIDNCGKKRRENREVIYETKRIHPTGKNSKQYYWFICTPNFPSELNKINDLHCHARKLDWSGEARISLYSTSLKIKKVKVKRGKISDSNLNDVEKLVIENKELIYEEWKSVWVVAWNNYWGIKQ